MILRSYFVRKTFFIFSSKKLEVVTIARYLNAFWIFDFSLLDILPKYMNPKSMSRSLYVSDDFPEKSGPTDPQTDGHHFLNVCHTKALRAIILIRSSSFQKAELIHLGRTLLRRLLLPEGLLCGRRLKNDVRGFVCVFVCLSVCPDFSVKSSPAYSQRDINFGFIYLVHILRQNIKKRKVENTCNRDFLKFF